MDPGRAQSEVGLAWRTSEAHGPPRWRREVGSSAERFHLQHTSTGLNMLLLWPTRQRKIRRFKWKELVLSCGWRSYQSSQKALTGPLQQTPRSLNDAATPLQNPETQFELDFYCGDGFFTATFKKSFHKIRLRFLIYGCGSFMQPNSLSTKKFAVAGLRGEPNHLPPLGGGPCSHDTTFRVDVKASASWSARCSACACESLSGHI